ncbi:MAG: decaprenyl-phosphate phosphoribosyltransferase [Anaerolineae bacterium]|nr:decaprenyl-phosphate phosphoribosyltransferase [Thermoflexales bacterium]MDW8407456.1 decaprenyl-phosphate phosphoribosyltransferase [Anaerolineae bacterium]
MQFIVVTRGLWRAMRPRQWTKNAFVFAALVFDNKLFTAHYLLDTVLGFAIFCFLSSAVYLINDVADAPADRSHPTKRNRPIARGDVSPAFALVFAGVLVLIASSAAFVLDVDFGWIGLGYFALMVAYTFRLKHVVILDVLVIAAGFVLRVAGGAVLVDAVRFSPWMYVCMMLLSLLLGFGKRRQEIVELNGRNSTRAILNEYNRPLLDQIIGIVTAATIVSYALYTFSAPQLPRNHTMMLTIPFVLYGLFRYLYLVHVRGEGGAPDELVLADRPMQAALGLWALAVMLVLYVLPPE